MKGQKGLILGLTLWLAILTCFCVLKVRNIEFLAQIDPLGEVWKDFDKSKKLLKTALETSDRPFSNAVSRFKFELDLKNLEGIEIG
mgnify:CR=1 FL=1